MSRQGEVLTVYRRAWLSGLCALLVILADAVCLGGGGPKNVLLVVNQNSSESRQIGAYYKQKRGIPSRNVCRLYCSTDELVSKEECENNIVAPIRDYIDSAGIHDRIDYIVLTKGIPLKASYNDSSWLGSVSVTSVLTCVGEPSITTPCFNPYSQITPDQCFTHQLSFNGLSYYAVTRLDAYTVEQVFRMIDDSLDASASGRFLLDGRYEWQTWSQYYKANDRLRQANQNLHMAGFDTYHDPETFDSMINGFPGEQEDLVGCFTWGSNDSYYTHEAYTSNHFVPGSIADSYVSTSGRTFTYPPSVGQSLIADLIPQGLSGGNGYVSEPMVSLQTYPNVLFDRYTRGYNMAESFMAATPRLYWKAVTVGDPLMAPYATPPNIEILSPPAGEALNGMVSFAVTAEDQSGVRMVEFYIDDVPVHTAEDPPYEFLWDTTQVEDGFHVLEAIAYEDTNIYTQGMKALNVIVRNTPPVITIGDVRGFAVGDSVALENKLVTAGTDAFADCIYISELDRSAGIKVFGAEDAPTGYIVNVEGQVIEVDGEKAILSAPPENTLTLLEMSNSPPRPLLAQNRFVANTNGEVLSDQLIQGISNVGVLVTTWGRVIEFGDQEFQLYDGSMVFKNEAAQTLLVSLRNLQFPLNPPPLNSLVMVTGVSCYIMDEGQLKPGIRPSSSDSIRIIQD